MLPVFDGDFWFVKVRCSAYCLLMREGRDGTNDDLTPIASFPRIELCCWYQLFAPAILRISLITGRSSPHLRLSFSTRCCGFWVLPHGTRTCLRWYAGTHATKATRLAVIFGIATSAVQEIRLSPR